MSESKQISPSLDEVDIAVVGGGVAGCYTAWRLQTLSKEQLAPNSPLAPLFANKQRLNVGLFEYADRIGGRLWSVALDGMPGEIAEFGGMRFYKQMHVVWNLIEKLGLAERAIPFPVRQANNFVYVRGEHLRSEQVAKNPDLLPYKFRYLETGKSSGAMIDYVCNTAIEGFGQLRSDYGAAFAREDWEQVRKLGAEYEARKSVSKIGNRTVYDMSWWELQTYLLSNEAFDCILTTSGYDVTNTNGNAAHSIDQLFYGPDDWEFYRLSNGFEELPDTLQKVFHESGGSTYMLHRLLRFDKVNPGVEGGPYELQFHRRVEGGDTICDLSAAALERHGMQVTRVRAKMLVLALPVRALNLLDRDNFFFKPSPRGGIDRQAQMDAALNSVLNVQAFKLFLAYHRPWWEQTGVSKGQSVTDLPVRQCYYWATAAQNTGDIRNAILMATYNNGVAVPYWQSLQSGETYPEPGPMAASHRRAFMYVNRVANRLQGGADKTAPAPDPIEVRTATKAMVERAHAQLMEMHGVKYAPPPFDAHFQDWDIDPYGGAWHQWKASSKVEQLIPYMQQPMLEEQVFVVGECWSDAQGWVQGALNTSETMLQKKLKLTWPEWLQKGGTWLGP